MTRGRGRRQGFEDVDIDYPPFDVRQCGRSIVRGRRYSSLPGLLILPGLVASGVLMLAGLLALSAPLFRVLPVARKSGVRENSVDLDARRMTKK